MLSRMPGVQGCEGLMQLFLYPLRGKVYIDPTQPYTVHPENPAIPGKPGGWR